MAGEVAGQDFVIAVSLAGSVYTNVGVGTANSFSVNNEPVDITSKDSIWQVLMDGKGKKSVTMDVSGFVSDNAGYAILRDQSFSASASLLYVKMVRLDNDDEVVGRFHISNFGNDAPDKAGSTFSASFTSTGTISYTEGA